MTTKTIGRSKNDILEDEQDRLSHCVAYFNDPLSPSFAYILCVWKRENGIPVEWAVWLHSKQDHGFSCGNYFRDLGDAVEFFNEKKGKALLTQLKSGKFSHKERLAVNYYHEQAKNKRPIAKVTETRLPAGSHHYRRYLLEGDPNFVILEVAKRLNADDTTEMYDHMKLTVEDVQLVKEQGKPTILKVTMFKNLYAGD